MNRVLTPREYMGVTHEFLQHTLESPESPFRGKDVAFVFIVVAPDPEGGGNVMVAGHVHPDDVAKIMQHCIETSIEDLEIEARRKETEH